MEFLEDFNDGFSWLLLIFCSLDPLMITDEVKCFFYALFLSLVGVFYVLIGLFELLFGREF